MNESLDRLDPQFGPPADLAILDASAEKIGFEVPGPLGPRRMRPRFAIVAKARCLGYWASFLSSSSIRVKS
ncbi:hypothetical protein MCEMSE15_01731 [Fimbriimonadaceae bacterium]